MNSIILIPVKNLLNFLSIVKPKQVLGALLFSVIFQSLSVATANACITINQYRYIFYESPPENLQDATFVGEIEIKKVKQDHTVIAVLKASETHPHQVGNKLQLAYMPTSCGPWVNKGDSGFVIGNSREEDGKFYVMPYSTRRSPWQVN